VTRPRVDAPGPSSSRDGGHPEGLGKRQRLSGGS
jgi:hypothetical protein